MKYGRYKPITEIPFALVNEEELEEALTHNLDLSTIGLEERVLSLLTDLQSDRDRVVILLLILKSYGFKFRNKQIAKMFGVDAVWVKKLKWRSIKRLREMGHE